MPEIKQPLKRNVEWSPRDILEADAELESLQRIIYVTWNYRGDVLVLYYGEEELEFTSLRTLRAFVKGYTSGFGDGFNAMMEQSR